MATRAMGGGEETTGGFNDLWFKRNLPLLDRSFWYSQHRPLVSK